MLFKGNTVHYERSYYFHFSSTKLRIRVVKIISENQQMAVRIHILACVILRFPVVIAHLKYDFHDTVKYSFYFIMFKYITTLNF